MNKKEGERLAVMETKLEDHVKQNDKDNNEIKHMLGKLDDKFDKLSSNFAGKWTEKAIWIIITAIVTTGIGAIIIL